MYKLTMKMKSVQKLAYEGKNDESVEGRFITLTILWKLVYFPKYAGVDI